MKTENQRLVVIKIVNQLIEMGAPVWAVGPEHFVVTDSDLPEEFDAQIGETIRVFGPMDHIIRILTDQNPFAHSLRPMDMIRHGWLSSFRQASQQ